jgi:acetyl esterase/lipase
MNPTRLVVLFILLVWLLRVPSRGVAQTPEEIPYVPDGEAYQVLEIYLPEAGDGPFPVILEFHGAGSSPGGPAYMRSHLLEQGYALVGVDYNENDLVQGVNDSFCALAWLHTSGADYNLDATRTVGFGFSLGASMVSYLGTVDDPDMVLADCPHTTDDQLPLRGVIDFAGAVLLSPEWPDWILSDFTGFSVDEVAAMRESIWQIPANEWADTLTGDEREFASRTCSFWIDGSEPPLLIIQGASDVSVPPIVSIRFAEELVTAGSPVELLLLPAIGHTNMVGLPGSPVEELTATVDAFLERGFTVDEAEESP